MKTSRRDSLKLSALALWLLGGLFADAQIQPNPATATTAAANASMYQMLDFAAGGQ